MWGSQFSPQPLWGSQSWDLIWNPRSPEFPP
jgi:hypothetical protein